jgi:peptidoglycan/xylan/chitin deacetylase (PgdA/CDA1 family)
MMHRTWQSVVGIAVVACGLHALAAQTPAPASAPPAPQRASVALTFDDLPSHGPIPAGLTRTEIASRIIAALRNAKSPPIYGFVNARQLEQKPEDVEVLKLWRAAGFPLGNHAYSHMDLYTNSADAFQQDIAANETTLRTLMTGADWHWFRYPYLREGDTPEKYRAVRTYLQQQKYRVAQVTLSFDDYAYNDPYARCLAKNDTQGIEWLKESYVTRAAASLTKGQLASQTLFGRDIKHIMLLHIGGFETVMVPRLLNVLKARGFTLTTLEDASSDEAYRNVPALQSWNGTFLEQMMSARNPQQKPAPDDFMQKVGAICR